MISNLFAVFAVIALVFIGVFIIWSLKTQHLKLLHKLYMALAICYAVWVLALLIMKFVDQDNTYVLFCLDAVTNSTGPLMPALYLCIALAFLGGLAETAGQSMGAFCDSDSDSGGGLDKSIASSSVQSIFNYKK